ncbi:MAG: YD repeat-containing protein [Nitrospirae bacterium]|nr:MAG: YD repeat-containing protein [Nitrospirota bacterium]
MRKFKREKFPPRADSPVAKKVENSRCHLPLIASCAIIFVVLMAFEVSAEYVGCVSISTPCAVSSCPSLPVAYPEIGTPLQYQLPAGSSVCPVNTTYVEWIKGQPRPVSLDVDSYTWDGKSWFLLGWYLGWNWSGDANLGYYAYFTLFLTPKPALTWHCNNVSFDCATCKGTSSGDVNTGIPFSSPSPGATTVCGGKSIFETGDGNWNCSQCTNGETKACPYSGPQGGICKAGMQTCTNGQWGACEGEVLPATQETCGDNLDNNCDGNTDEGCVVCEDKDGDGYSAYNATSCPQGNDCNDFNKDINPGATEACNTRDDNCNGLKDETCMGGSCSNIPLGSTANPGSGNLYHDQTLFNTTTLGLTLSYNSKDNFNSPLGKGWTHNYNLALFSNFENSIGLKQGDGKVVYFRLDNGIYYPDANSGEDSYITYTSETYTLIEKDGTTYNFNSLGKLISVRDRNGNTTTLTYNGDSLTAITDPSGRTITLTYDSTNRISSVRDINNNTYTFAYTDGNALSAISYQQSAWTYSYDANGQLLTKTDPQGYITTYVYDSEGRVTSSIDPEGKTKAISYPLLGGQEPSASSVSVTEKDGGVWTYKYDPLLNVTTQKTDPQGNTTAYTYDQYKNLISKTEPDGGITSYTYDEYGNMASVTDSAGNITAYTYNEFGQTTSITDSEGNVTRYEYDSNGNQTAVIDSTGAVTRYQYDQRGNITEITYSNGQKTQMTYDQFNNMISITDPSGLTTRFTYDIAGNILAQMDSTGNTTEYTYDSLNRLIKLIEPNGSITQYTYDEKGNRTSSTDANLNIIQYVYNYKDQLIKVLDPLSGITTYEYGGTGCPSCGSSGDKLTAIIDAMGNRTAFEYDLLGRLTKETNSLGKVIAYSYDARGNMLTKSDENGNIINYAYDTLSRLTKKTYPDGTTEEYRYDSKSNLIYAGNQWIAYNFVYDAKGRLVAVTDSNGRVITYQYDSMGNRISMTTSEGKIITYKYDASNRLIEIASEGQIFIFAYDTLGRRIKLINPNGTYTTYSYDKNSMLTELVHKDSKGSIINSFTYTHDKVGNRLTKTELDKKTTYTYDPLYRLTQALPTKLQGKDKTQENKQETFSYDPVGNRLIGPRANDYYSYNQGNQLTNDRKNQYEYDANGNLVKKTTSEGMTAYFYDYENRLIKVVKQENNETVVVSFKYDPFGRRIEKKVAGDDGTKTYNYVYDNEDIILEYETKTDGKVETTRYTHGLGIDEPLAVEQKGNVYYYHADGLGSIIALTDKRQKTVQSYTYDSFGVMKQSGDKVKQPYTYTAREWDEEIKLYFNRARYRDPYTGIFTTKDPILHPANGPPIGACRKSDSSQMLDASQSHPYIYSNNNPITKKDPLGLFSIAGDCCGKENKIRQEVQSSCSRLNTIVTDLKLRNCISKSCSSGTIRCTNCDNPRLLGYSYGKILWLFPRRSFYLCVGNVRNANFGDIALHEWSHGCGWEDGELGKGVPGEAGYIYN